MTIKNLATVYSAELEGVEAKLIEVETDLNVGLHAFNIVGLADKALNEAKERVNSALKNVGVKPPNRENRKITINLAPADIKKTGSQYDLAIAIGYLLATSQIAKFKTKEIIFIGELALDGRLRPINGALNIAEMAARNRFKYIFLPRENASEASAIKDIHVIGINNLREALQIIQNGDPNALSKIDVNKINNDHKDNEFEGVQLEEKSNRGEAPDFSEIKGLESAKRALIIAAAGGHNILMTGSPGVGKSFLARAFAGILPELSIDESIETTKIWSAAGLRPSGLLKTRPFRAPHQTTSGIALIGGGQDPKPGEISLAHRGVLFLDEMPEFQRSALESLRQPMESGFIAISRAKGTLIFPAKFILIAAMNPCPCGYYGDQEKACKCSAYEVIRYQKRISGPLLDRIDLQIKVGRITIEDLRRGEGGQRRNHEIKTLVSKVRADQTKRQLKINADLTAREVQEITKVDQEGESFLKTIEHSSLSPRGYYRLLKVARTIADLESKEGVSKEHLAEAFNYRLRDEI